MSPKVSIIVPVYKVEEYLHKCVDSILAQTFKDFELILVDDGSPDKCGEICEEYSKKDTRIKVIHKQNGGLSDARNAGLDIAIGEYIGFVDSDDWIEPDMYQTLYNLCEENDCDIASCTSIIHFKDKNVINGDHPLTIHDRKEAMKAMLQGELYDEVVWTKLFKKSVIGETRFKVGIIYEDTAFTYKLIHKSEKVCCIGAPKYHYIKRENSTMDKAVKDIKIDGVLIYDEMYQFIEKHYSELINLVALKLGNASMVVMNLMSVHPNFHQHKQNYYTVVGILNRYFTKTVQLKEYPKGVKVLLTACKVHPLLYKILINAMARRKPA